MNMATYGFIGVGNMGGALARAVCRTAEPDEIFLANHTLEKAKALAEELGCRVTDNSAIAESADFIFLGVKPQMMEGLLTQIGPLLAARKTRFILVTMDLEYTLPPLRRQHFQQRVVLPLRQRTIQQRRPELHTHASTSFSFSLF